MSEEKQWRLLKTTNRWHKWFDKEKTACGLSISKPRKERNKTYDEVTTCEKCTGIYDEPWRIG